MTMITMATMRTDGGRGGNPTGVICHRDQHTSDDDDDYSDNDEDRLGLRGKIHCSDLS